MAIHCGPLRAEVTAPESEKFTAPMVLVHGLWERASTWRRFAGYLAHRGWRCIALERRADAAADLMAHVADLRVALDALDAPPVVVGHDLGAVFALHCAERARAIVGLAPLVGAPLADPPPALARAGSWLARWRGVPLGPPGGRWRSAYPSREVVEPAALVRQVFDHIPPPTPAPALPSLVLALEDDPTTPLTAARTLAQHVGAELITLPGANHAALVGPGWEAHVAAAHRWIIQRLGVDLLALYDEAMSPE